MGSESQINEAIQAHGSFRSFQLLHYEETFKIDFFLADEDEYTSASFLRAKQYELAPGRAFPVKSPEDILITKLRWFDLGRRISDKQWNDIVQVLEIQQDNLDNSYLDAWCNHFQLIELLDEARLQVVPSNPTDR